MVIYHIKTHFLRFYGISFYAKKIYYTTQVIVEFRRQVRIIVVVWGRSRCVVWSIWHIIQGTHFEHVKLKVFMKTLFHM